MEKIILIGGGGHCKVIIDAITLGGRYRIVGITDPRKDMKERVCGVPVIGPDSALERYFKKGVRSCFLAIGTVRSEIARAKLYKRIAKFGFSFPNVIHPRACVSKFAYLGEGNYVGPGAIINADAVVGDHCIINTGALVDHDCVIGDYVHVATGVSMSAGVVVGEYAHIGTGSSIVQYVKIGGHVTIGAGSVVVCSTDKAGTYVGNPARRIK